MFASAYMGRKRWAPPNFLPRDATNVRHAAFMKESRMEFANAIKAYRKSGAARRSLLIIQPMDSLLSHRPILLTMSAISTLERDSKLE
jgi:hypothetical protein